MRFSLASDSRPRRGPILGVARDEIAAARCPFGLPELACRRVREPAERPIRGLRTGGRQRLDDSLGLLLRRHTRKRLAAQRKDERACGLLADTRVAGLEVLQKVSDNVAALEAAERAHSRPLNTDIAGSGERAQRAQILRQRRACILNRQHADETRRRSCLKSRRESGGAGQKPRLATGRAHNERRCQHAGDRGPGALSSAKGAHRYSLRPEYSSICVVRSSGYEIVTSVIVPSASRRPASSFGMHEAGVGRQLQVIDARDDLVAQLRHRSARRRSRTAPSPPRSRLPP